MFGDSTLFDFRGPMGVRVEVQSSFLLLVLLVAIFFSNNILVGVIFLLMLTLSIFLHEMGHAWAHVAQKVPVKRVVITGGGGFCESLVSPTRQQEEFIVAMGPIVNLMLWAIASGISQAGLIEPETVAATILSYFALLNLFLFVFNMLPMQPLDGGRLLHLVLKRFTSPLRALKITGGVGLVMCVLWIPTLILLLLYVGIALFFIPSFRLHWDMFKAGS